ncbi:hypothetical protein HK405_009809 [Cladochytrium tenue]|nr:hypothetical protein HK405_009809 [Cladochytrium tenue]
MSSSTVAAETIEEDVVVPEASSAAPERVVAVAVDGSVHSDYAFQWTIDNMLRAGTDRLLLINVRPPFPEVWTSNIGSMEDEERDRSHALLREFASKLPEPARHNTRAVSVAGDPRDAIAWKVEHEKVDVLVVGSRGLSPLSRSLMGSCSDFLVRHLQIPVLVVKKPGQLTKS